LNGRYSVLPALPSLPEEPAIPCWKLSEISFDFPRQVVGFHDADAFGKIRHRFGESLDLFLMVAGFPQRVFSQSVTKGQGGDSCLCRNRAKRNDLKANETPSRYCGEA
jgi:hypothetical protein